MSGTAAWYQGLPCRDVRFRRTRGWKADTSTVVFFTTDFPDHFELITPRPGDLLRPTTSVRVDLSALRAGDPTPRPLLAPRRLEFAGPLVMAEVDRTGKEFLVTVDPLYCVALETVRRNHDGSVAIVLARLVDARYFYAQGFVRRWSFNRTDPEGRYARDSVKPGGEPFSLAEIAQDVAGQLFASPGLTTVPDRWREVRPVLELPRFSPAAAALTRLAQEHGAGELCLNLDGSVALPAPGDGRVGYAPDGKGPGNPADFPADLLLDLRGAGQARGIEATYPPDYVVVVGGLRVATVRMDDLEPVLVIEGFPIPLTEGTVRTLTSGRFGLEWLNQFVLAPQAYQNATGLDPRVVQLLREQAWRLWRLPGVEIDQAFREGPGPAPPQPGPAPASLQDAPLPSFEQLMSGQRRATAGEPNRVKGPNAHLLPLRDRAETVAGRRLPVRVDTYRFASVHRAMSGSAEAAALATARKELQKLREEIHQAARSKNKPDPFDGASWFFGSDTRYLGAPELGGLLRGLGLRHVTDEHLQRAVNQHRLLDRIRAISGDQATRYEANLKQLYQLDEQGGGPGSALFDLARKVVSFEKEAAERRSYGEALDDQAREEAARLRDELQAQLRALDRQAEERKRRTAVGATPAATEQLAVFVRNLPRQLDPDARVYSAELGVIQTSDLSGQVAEEGVPMAEATSFVPKSPLVTFGAVLRPRVDGGRRGPVTGGKAGSETRIPAILTDAESYYTAAFKRTAQGRAEPLPLVDVAPGQGVPVERPDLVELVPLEGESNRGTLDETACGVADGLFARPDRIESARWSIARPWPVNCDGVVAGVEIAMRPNGKGFVTTIHTGSEAPQLHPLDRTRVRVRRGGLSDAAAREGTLP